MHKLAKLLLFHVFFFIIKLLQQIIIEENNNLFQISNKVHQKTTRVYMLALATLHQFCMTSPVNMSFDLGHWVIPRSTIWFSRFLLTKYMMMNVGCTILEWARRPFLRLLIDWNLHQRQIIDTNYQSSIMIKIKVACSIYKLAHGVNFPICSKLFALGKSTIYLVLHEVVYTINKIFKNLISWPKGDDMQTIMTDF
jgi:hypothetical protein